VSLGRRPVREERIQKIRVELAVRGVSFLDVKRAKTARGLPRRLWRWDGLVKKQRTSGRPRLDRLTCFTRSLTNPDWPRIVLCRARCNREQGTKAEQAEKGKRFDGL